MPKTLKRTAYPFNINDTNSFKKAVQMFKGKIAAIIMEPVRSDPPNMQRKIYLKAW